MQKLHLENILLDIEENKENFSLLTKSFNKNDFVAFLGAGILSVIKGVPDAKELYLELKKKYGLKRKGEGTPVDFSYLYNKCRQKEDFYKDIFALVTSFWKKTRGSRASELISNAFDCFVTTNYYDPIEGINEKIGKYFFVFPDLSKQRNSITYLHGHHEIGFGVVKKDDYRFFYPSLYNNNKGVPVLENSLHHLFTKKRVVFFGCRLEDDLRDYLKGLSNKIDKDDIAKNLKKEDVNEHFWIIDDSVVGKNKSKKKAEIRDLEKTFFEGYLDIKVRPIVYAEGHHYFVEDLCKVLSEKKPIVLDKQPDPSRVWV